MSMVTRQPVIGISDQIRLKPAIYENSFSTYIPIIHVFHALAFAGSQRSHLNMELQGHVFNHFPMDLASLVLFVCLFDLIIYVPSTIFQLNRDRSSWVEPVLCWGNVSCSRTTTQWRRWGSNSRPFSLESSTQPLSHCFLFVLFDFILYVPSTIFQLYRDRSSWVEPVLS